MLHFYCRNYAPALPMLTLNLTCCLLFVFETTSSTLIWLLILLLYSENSYTMMVIFSLVLFSSLLKKDNHSMLYFLSRYSLNSTLINCYFRFLLELGTAVTPYYCCWTFLISFIMEWLSITFLMMRKHFAVALYDILIFFFP